MMIVMKELAGSRIKIAGWLLVAGFIAFASGCDFGSKEASGQRAAVQTSQQIASTPQTMSNNSPYQQVLTGEAAMGDWTTDAPGVRRKLTPADLPAPFATNSVRNRPHIVSQPQGVWPQVP